MKTGLALPAIFILLLIASCSSPSKNGESKSVVVYDSLENRDSLPIRQMPDTLSVSAQHPLIISDRESSDSVHLYPYSLLFRSLLYDAYLVSFADYSPTLVTLDKKQLMLDSVTLLPRMNPGSPSYHRKSSAVVSDPQSIVIYDSVFTWETNEDGKRIESSRKVKGKIRTVTISPDGLISPNN